MTKHPYLCEMVNMEALEAEELIVKNTFKIKFKDVAKDLNSFWKKSDRFKPLTTRNSSFFCQKDDRQKVVNMKVTGDCFITVLGPRTRYFESLNINNDPSTTSFLFSGQILLFIPSKCLTETVRRRSMRLAILLTSRSTWCFLQSTTSSLPR